jgi:pyruvate formate-lyase activating enzyme-like uncharacterized protein
MAKIKFDNYDFDFNPKMSPEEFINLNEWYYSESWLENNPEKAYKINDWDLEEMYNDLSREDVSDLMTELYRENLFINYWN